MYIILFKFNPTRRFIMQSLGSSPFQGVPDELNLHIFQFLNVRDVGMMARTCKQFERLSQDEQVWKSSCQNTFGEFTKTFRKEDQTWKQTCQVIAQHKKNSVAIEKNIDRNVRVSNLASRIFGHSGTVGPIRNIPHHISLRGSSFRQLNGYN
ncbi:MAG: hypothetical protein CK425_12780 [Parachlamydia sp.]|nr:MAG: hypothetical protein CK425_12780 [Parachlamydia sp.]